MLGASFDADSPRKFIRMHLLNQEGAAVFGGRTVCNQGAVHTFENLYARTMGWKDQTIFPVVFEPFSGEPFIESIRMLTPAGTPRDANAPVAMEIHLGPKAGNRIDVVYIAPRDSKATEIPGVGTIEGEYALISRDAKGIRQVTLSGGTKLITKDCTIQTALAAYEGKIQSVNFRTHTLTLAGVLPESTQGQVMEVGPGCRPTAYMLAKVQGTQVQLDKGMDLAASRVTSINDDGTIETKTPLAFEGHTLSDDSGKNVWRVGEYKSEAGLKLIGSADVKSTIHAGDMLWVWEVGPGDAYRLPIKINVRRDQQGQYKVESNTSATIQIAGQQLTNP